MKFVTLLRGEVIARRTLRNALLDAIAHLVAENPNTSAEVINQALVVMTDMLLTEVTK